MREWPYMSEKPEKAYTSNSEGLKVLKEAHDLASKTLADIRNSQNQMEGIFKALGISKEDLKKAGDESKLSKYEKDIFDMAMKEYTAEIHATSGSREASTSKKARPNVKLSKKGLKI